MRAMVYATEIGKPASGRREMNQNPNSFLSSLMNNDTQQTIPSYHHKARNSNRRSTLQGRASAGTGSGMHGRLGPREVMEMQPKSMYTLSRDSACFTERS